MPVHDWTRVDAGIFHDFPNVWIGHLRTAFNEGLLPPGFYALSDDRYELPGGEPLTLASYAAGPQVEVYLEHLAVGAALPEMPLFLRPDRYVNVPLEPTYQAACRDLPAFWREVLEAPSPPAV